MPADDFRTVPDELLHVAADTEVYFQSHGYDVVIETREIGFPFAPTLVCRRGHETVIVEISSVLDQRRTERWIRYCKSQIADTRFCAVLRSEGDVAQQTLSFVIENRLGLCIHNDKQLTEVRAAADLAVHVALPEVADLTKPLRPILAPAFRKVRENDWRDGLFDAYSEVEQHAREYLKEGIDSGRVIVMVKRRKQIVPLTAADVDGMTLGQLKNAFMSIQNQTHKDARIGACLAMIHKARNGLAHKRRSHVVEAELRQQVGQHMYAAITCLEELTA
jgi:hypothetical protein